jgi:D-lactate dehydrogenase (cytochrome)
VPVIAFGTGSSLEGQVNAANGGISIDFSRMNGCLRSTPRISTAPSSRRHPRALNIYLRDTGLFFPIDPGANASIGGMASTRASGTNAVRYGTMKDNVLAVTAVTANGEEIRTARRARKSSAGYDLTRLFVGAEGTLGILTSVTLRLQGIPQKIAGGVCAFPSVKAACDAVIMTIQMGIPVARIELLDTCRCGPAMPIPSSPMPKQPTLFLEFHGTDETVSRCNRKPLPRSPRNAAAANSSGPPMPRSARSSGRPATTPIGRARRWRRGLRTFDRCLRADLEACRLRPRRRPISRSTGCWRRSSAMPATAISMCCCCSTTRRAEDIAMAESFRRAAQCAGARHGRHLHRRTRHRPGQDGVSEQELGGAVDLMRQVKQALDPDNIFNPGKIFIIGKKVVVTAAWMRASSVSLGNASRRPRRPGSGRAADPRSSISRWMRNWRPFLSGEALIFDMRLDRPRRRSGFCQDGTLDWARGRKASIPAKTVILENVAITGGQIDFIDEQTGRTRRITGLEADLSARRWLDPGRWKAVRRSTARHGSFAFSSSAADETGTLGLRSRLTPDKRPFGVELDGELKIVDFKPVYQGKLSP